MTGATVYRLLRGAVFDYAVVASEASRHSCTVRQWSNTVVEGNGPAYTFQGHERICRTSFSRADGKAA